jgi:hypothetical protein
VHARVAALARHRQPDDPDVVTARAQLAVCREETTARRALGSLPPEARARFLASLQGATSV